MMKNFEDLQKVGTDGWDATLKSFDAASKGVQTVAVEVTDYARKSFEQSTATAEKLFGAKTLESAIEVQSDYARTAYEGFVAQVTKLGGLYTDMAKETYKPIEAYLTKAAPVA